MKSKAAREKLNGTFTDTDDSQVAVAQNTVDDADADKARARVSADSCQG